MVPRTPRSLGTAQRIATRWRQTRLHRPYTACKSRIGHRESINGSRAKCLGTFFLSSGFLGPGVRPLWSPSVEVWFYRLSLGTRSSPVNRAGQLLGLSPAEGCGRQGEFQTSQEIRQNLWVIRRQKLRLRLLSATLTASWKTASTLSWSRAEHSR